MLGDQQERWLSGQLEQSGAQWNVMAQQQWITPFLQTRKKGETWWSEDWNGYPAARQRLIQTISDSGAKNPVSLAGDIHSFIATQVPGNAADFSSTPVASEFVACSISSKGPPYKQIQRMLGPNPQIKLFETRNRGDLRCHVTPERWHTEMVVVDAKKRKSPRHQLAGFTVNSGNPVLVRDDA